MATDAPTPTLRALLSRAELTLRLAIPASALAPDSLDRPIRWVHSSDLADPTPFLSEGLALLTTGTQFADFEEDNGYAAYVTRLTARGVVALGFGTEVVRAGIPERLAAACESAGLPLFEVPYRTPFIAIARANAEAIAAQAYARRSWSLSAQHAIALAAFRSDGLGATLAELSHQIGAWVGLFDAAGQLRRSHGDSDDAAPPDVAEEARRVLRRGARASSTLRVGERGFTLQTLGRSGELRGVVAVEGDLDQEARGVVTAVIAMADLALEQGRDLSRARAQLRSSLMHLLIAGHVPGARRVARGLWGGLPPAPVVVALTDTTPVRRDALRETLEGAGADGGPSLLFGRIEDGLVITCGAADTAAQQAIADAAAEHELSVGLSDPVPWERFAAGLGQARIARARVSGTGVARFGDAVSGGILSLVDRTAAREVARARLAPVLHHDEAAGTDLVGTLRAWLENDGSGQASAAALGIHRHTLRAHVALASRLLGVDLASFTARAELWNDLRALE
ncbi:PucR family transcriptional regulator [Microbacterium sp. NPDC078428]|uniref:PucR family transcriptional regulator n=1 Tax=Microbacterium sp. NPDC078428 TaxID=3364190 RepID=UPI0037C8E471